MSLPVIIDTDTGVDDALALILALRSPELSVKALTTVAGNVDVGRCTRNALKVLELLHQADAVPVFRGATRPLKRALVTAPEVHGSEGLGNSASLLKISHAPARQPAVDAISGLCRAYPGRLTIVALGPLTNIAGTLRQHPRALRRVRRIISMGGAFRVPGNTGPVAEFNYFVDPEAADAVLRSGLPLTIVPLDLTEQIVLMRRDLEERVRRRPSALSRFVARITKRYMRYHKKSEGFEGGFLHDPLAVAVALRPELFRYRTMRVVVETRGEWTRGMTIGEFHGAIRSGRPKVRVALRVDKERFLKLFHERLWA